MQYNFICIEGNIGVGKTTLVKRLAAHLGAHAVYEEFEENPWLPLFYAKTEGAELALELSFLTDRVRQLHAVQAALKEGRHAQLVSDYALDKCLLFAGINLQPPYAAQFIQLYEALQTQIIQPDLVVSIHSTVSALKQNIKSRNRSFEQNIQEPYLEKLNDAYRQFFQSERPYNTLNLFTSELNEAIYDQVFREILAFTQLKPLTRNTAIHL